MKSIINLCFFGIVLLIASCQKQKEEAEQLSKGNETNAETIFLLNGKTPVTYAEYQRRKLGKIRTERGSSEESIVPYEGDYLLFENDDELREWSLDKDSSGQIIALLNKQDSLIEYATQRGIIDDSLATLAYTDSLAGTEQSYGSTPLLSTLYNGYNYSGGTHSLAFISIRPTLGDFNGKASSLADWFLLPKLNFLASKTWFRGSKYFYWSYTFENNLGNVSFDNKAKSKL